MDEPRVCTPVALPEEHAPAAALRAVLHRAENVPEVADPHGLGGWHPQDLAGAPSRFWRPGTVLSVAFLGGSEALRARVLTRMRRWSEVGNIDFAPAGPGEAATVRVGFVPDGRSWSFTGTDLLSIAPDRPTMNLGWLTDATPEEEVRRVVVHETGHTLGFDHEFGLALALRTVRVDEAAVIAYYAGPPNYWSPEQTRRQVLRPLELAGEVHTPWDRKSIMEYALDPHWFVPPVDVPLNTDLSPWDIAAAQRWYGARGTPVPFPA